MIDISPYELTIRNTMVEPYGKIKYPAINTIMFCRRVELTGIISFTPVEIMYKFSWANQEYLDVRIFQGNNWGRITFPVNSTTTELFYTRDECEKRMLVDTLSGSNVCNYFDHPYSSVYPTPAIIFDYPHIPEPLEGKTTAWVNGNPQITRLGIPKSLDIYDNRLVTRSHPDWRVEPHGPFNNYSIYDIDDTPALQYDVVCLGYSAYALESHITKWLPFVKDGGYLVGTGFKKKQIHDIVVGMFNNVHKTSGSKWIVVP